MISHSPPIFSHSPPVSFLSDFMNRPSVNYSDEHDRTARYCRPQVIKLASKAMVNNATNAVASLAISLNNINSQNCNTTTAQNRTLAGCRSTGVQTCLERIISAPFKPIQPKSCLSRKTRFACPHTKKSCSFSSLACDSSSEDNDDEEVRCEECSKRRTRKKVIFADDEGLSLTEVRVMSEPSNVPPYWSSKFLEQITQGLVNPHPADQWTVDFKQPASDYLSFRQKIEREHVSLENVIVKDEESVVVGTVKVKNIDFKKEVIVRVTWDDWKSQQDIFCIFAKTYGPATCAHVVFDTFSFKITLPPSSKKLEFCICYRTNDQEYWDNNNGKNYTITKRSPFYYVNSCNDMKTSIREHKNQDSSMLMVESPGYGLGSWHQAPSPYW